VQKKLRCGLIIPFCHAQRDFAIRRIPDAREPDGLHPKILRSPLERATRLPPLFGTPLHDLRQPSHLQQQLNPFASSTAFAARSTLSRKSQGCLFFTSPARSIVIRGGLPRRALNDGHEIH